MFYWAKFKCEICAIAGSYQGWCLCRKSVVGDPTVKTDKSGFKYTEGEIQMYPVFKAVIDPWHYERAYWFLDPRILFNL
jgi:hypothetical protein